MRFVKTAVLAFAVAGFVGPAFAGDQQTTNSDCSYKHRQTTAQQSAPTTPQTVVATEKK